MWKTKADIFWGGEGGGGGVLPSQSLGGAYPKEKPPDSLQADSGLSHMYPK